MSEPSVHRIGLSVNPLCTVSVCLLTLCAPVVRLSVNPLCTAGKEVSQDEMDEMLESENTQIFTQNVRQLHLCSAILTLLSSPKRFFINSSLFA